MIKYISSCRAKDTIMLVWSWEIHETRRNGVLILKEMSSHLQTSAFQEEIILSTVFWRVKSHAVKYLRQRRGHSPVLCVQPPQMQSMPVTEQCTTVFPRPELPFVSAAKGQLLADVFKDISKTPQIFCESGWNLVWGMQVSEWIISQMMKMSLCCPTFHRFSKNWT